MPPVGGRTVYLDCHASTPCDPRVVEAMLPFFLETYANPSADFHAPGREAKEAVERARAHVAAMLGAHEGEVVFTGGATESNNLAILGAARSAPAGRKKVLASSVEHKSVLEPCAELARAGYEFHKLPVLVDGSLDLAALIDAADENTALVSVQAANNEIGTIQPIAEVAQVAHRVGAVFHCDAAQAAARIPIDVAAWDVDLLSVSAHKCYGPKGVGALYVRGGARAAPIDPIMFGGGQEHALRPGTLNVPGIVGFGKAVEVGILALEEESRRLERMRDWFESRILADLPETRRNGMLSRRLHGNSSLTFPGVEAEAVIANLPDIAISTGSACISGAPEPSYVLTATGLSREDAYATVRVGLGRFNMEQDIEYAARRIVEAVQLVQSLSGVAVS